jgi:hypothetical protein
MYIGTMLRGDDEAKAIIDLIHEACHLIEGVEDLGYYGTSNFATLDGETKIHNPAHYEELPARALGKSQYIDEKTGEYITFTPAGKNNPLSAEGAIRREANEELRKAWSAGTHMVSFLQDVYIAQMSGDRAPFADRQKFIMTLSKKMDLTIHEQATWFNRQVTTLDLTLLESVVNSLARMQAKINDENDEKYVISLPEEPAISGIVFGLDPVAEALLQTVINQHAALFNDPMRDRLLINWMANYYRRVPAV